MIGPRGRKALRDLAARPGRSILAVLGMAVGIFQIGMLLHKHAVLQPVLGGLHERTTPASAILVVGRAGEALVDSVRRVPGVGRAEARGVVSARARVGTDEWVPAMLQVVRDFDRQQLDTFTPDRGTWPPAAGEVLLERTALTVARARIGERLTLRADGADHAARIAGTAHAPGLAPAWMEHLVTGFVAADSPLAAAAATEIRIRVAEHPRDQEWIHQVADSVRAMLERAGHPVARIDVPPPDRHPHAAQMEAFLFLLLAFGLLSLLMGAGLAASTVHAMMAEELRQVGILEAIGATSRQIAAIYLLEVGLLAAAALAVAVPLAAVAGQAYAGFAAGILNADVSKAPFPWPVVGVEVAVGLLVPLAAALGPVAAASRIPVREALAGAGSVPFGARRIERWLARLRLPRPLVLSLRDAAARPGRLALTVAMLALGGAAFLSAMNVAAAWTRAVERDFERRRYDLGVALASPRPLADLERLPAEVPGVAAVESWPAARAWLLGSEGRSGSSVSLVGVPPGSGLLEPRLLAGRWLAPGDSAAAVVHHAVPARQPGLAVGGTVRLRVRGTAVELPVVGVVEELSPLAVIYAPRPAVISAARMSADSSRSLRIVTHGHGETASLAAARRLERSLAERGIEVHALHRLTDLRRGLLDHLVIIFAVLTLASLGAVLVGALGLGSSLALSVTQRTRQIGILGAIGARPRAIAFQVWAEALLVGALSWVAAHALALPLGWALGRACGRIFLGVPLPFHASPAASAAWLGVVLVLATAGGLIPARRAARLPVHRALSQV